MADDEKSEWRVILANWRDRASQSMIEEMIEALDANPRTLYRWIKGPSKPDSRRKILILEQHIPEIGPAFKEAFPQYYETSQNVVLRAVAPFYARVARAAARTERSLLLRTITRMVLPNLVEHVDTEQSGFVAVLAQLVSTQKKNWGDQLLVHAWSGYGTGIWSEFPVQCSFTVHKVSLCGLAVTTGEEAFLRRDQEQLTCAVEIAKEDLMRSAAAYPILRGGEIAGVVFLGALQPNFFTNLRREIIGHYVLMMDKAFRDHDFYPLSQVDIEVDERDTYRQFLKTLQRDYPDETCNQIGARLAQMFREYSDSATV